MTWIKPRRRQSSNDLFKVLTINVRENRKDNQDTKASKHRYKREREREREQSPGDRHKIDNWVQSTKPSWYLYLPHQTHLKLKNQLFRNMTLKLIVLDHLIPKCMDARDFLHFLFHKKCPCQFKTCSIVFMFYCFQRYMVTGDLCHFSFPKNVPRSGMSATESSLSPDPKIYDCWIRFPFKSLLPVP
jgi:hypothetical protein